MGCWGRYLGRRRSKSDGRKLYNEEHHDFYSPYKWMRMTWIVCGIYGGEKCIQSLSCKTERKRPLGRPSFRWDDNTKFYLKEVDGRVQTEFVWLRIGTCGRAL
jgi:hypothetical protein